MATQGAQSKALIDLLKTGDYSDLTISCGQDQYRVHKAIVCPRSHFFKAACDGEFKEAQTGTINLSDDDPTVVRMMIEYLYHDTYTPPAKTSIVRDSAIDMSLSTADDNEENEKRKRELGDTAVTENKRTKRLDAPADDSRALPSQTPGLYSGFAATPPAPPRAAAQERNRESGRKGRGRGSFGGPSFSSGHNTPQGWPNQSSSTPRPFHFVSVAPASTPPPPQRPSSPHRPIPPAYLHLHTKVYALGEKYGIEPLKALALSKFEFEVERTCGGDDFLKAVREAYTSTIETDRPLRDAVVAFFRKHKHYLKSNLMEAVLTETSLGFDLLMELASE